MINESTPPIITCLNCMHRFVLYTKPFGYYKNSPEWETIGGWVKKAICPYCEKDNGMEEDFD